jgi:hypothetical protein
MTPLESPGLIFDSLAMTTPPQAMVMTPRAAVVAVITPTALETLTHMARATSRPQAATAETLMTLTARGTNRPQAATVETPTTLTARGINKPRAAMAEAPMTLTAPQILRPQEDTVEAPIHTALETLTHMALETLPDQEATAVTMTTLTAPAAIRKVTPWLASSWRRQVACSRATLW